MASAIFTRKWRLISVWIRLSLYQIIWFKNWIYMTFSRMYLDRQEIRIFEGLTQNTGVDFPGGAAVIYEYLRASAVGFSKPTSNIYILTNLSPNEALSNWSYDFVPRWTRQNTPVYFWNLNSHKSCGPLTAILGPKSLAGVHYHFRNDFVKKMSRRPQ